MFLKGNLLGRIGALVLVLDAFALTAIGFFPENVKPTHFYASVTFFVFFPISMLFLGAAFLRTSNTKLGFFTLIVAVVAAVVWIIPFGKGVAIPETVSGLSASMWAIVSGFKMLQLRCDRKSVQSQSFKNSVLIYKKRRLSKEE